MHFRKIATTKLSWREAAGKTKWSGKTSITIHAGSKDSKSQVTTKAMANKLIRIVFLLWKKMLQTTHPIDKTIIRKKVYLQTSLEATSSNPLYGN